MFLLICMTNRELFIKLLSFSSQDCFYKLVLQLIKLKKTLSHFGWIDNKANAALVLPSRRILQSLYILMKFFESFGLGMSFL